MLCGYMPNSSYFGFGLGLKNLVLFTSLVRERIWMSEDDDGASSYRVERTHQKQRLMRAETKYRVVTRNHQKRLKHHR